MSIQPYEGQYYTTYQSAVVYGSNFTNSPNIVCDVRAAPSGVAPRSAAHM